ncbi:hypothetical protein [Mesorhizobium sp. M1252]|uniref:hypothetical protein n=1 Tax=Mesorhizobium sp. M1252 TaxID=2957073 RepID=UPI00333CB436
MIVDGVTPLCGPNAYGLGSLPTRNLRQAGKDEELSGNRAAQRGAAMREDPRFLTHEESNEINVLATSDGPSMAIDSEQKNTLLGEQ